MKNKYKSVGLNYDLILEKYPNIDEYEEIVNSYLSDEFFVDLKKMLKDEDYALAKDATKGLYILASELCLYPLYEALLDMYEDFEYESFQDLDNHYKEMFEIYKKIRGVFHA